MRRVSIHAVLCALVNAGPMLALATAADTIVSPVHASGGQTFDVTAYGAVGDGVADDAPAIQRAIHAAMVAGGGTVYFPARTYLLNSHHPSRHPWMFYNLIIGSNVTLSGQRGARLLQGPRGRHALPARAKEVQNTVCAFGLDYTTIRFQSLSHNGGFRSLKPTHAGATTVTLAKTLDASYFAKGDYVAIYAQTSGDVLPTETSQIASVDASTGVLSLTQPLARSFSTPAIAKVTSLATTKVSMENLIVQGAEPLAVTEAFGFTAQGNQLIIDTSIGGGNVTGLNLNTLNGFQFIGNTVTCIGPSYCVVELPQRNSQNGVLEGNTFEVKQMGMGEYAAHWRFTKNTFTLHPDYTGRRPGWNTEAGQIAAAKITRQLGCDTHWMDAAWFEGGFPGGVGNWTVRPREYPRGLGPIGQACDKLGLKFLVWWEPERVAAGTRIAREHPAFVLGGSGGGLFNLGNPDARRWMTDLLLKQIDEFGVDTYRNDFNIDPLGYWRAADAPDRQGMAEIRYVEGLYEMWDAIRAKHPGMVPDDCASGGRRIDLEMCMRSIVQTRSDTACAPGRADWDQCQAAGLSLFLPVHATIGWDLGTYDCRSTAASGYLGEWDILDPNFPVEQAKADIAEIRANQDFWYGDFYPLTACTLAADAWMVWQLHLGGRDEGIVLAFRRAASPYSALQVQIEGLSSRQAYAVTFSDEQRRQTTRTMSGAELARLELRLDKPRTSLLVRYKPVSPQY